uniref:Uncharacterized protein n=1 Tax=Cairina moschata TaxID=8855 RepID=A0A8C3BI43_CAIMO
MALASVLRLPAEPPPAPAAFPLLAAPRDAPGPPQSLAAPPWGTAEPPGPGLQFLHGTTTLAFKVRGALQPPPTPSLAPSSTTA